MMNCFYVELLKVGVIIYFHLLQRLINNLVLFDGFSIHDDRSMYASCTRVYIKTKTMLDR